MYSCESGGVTSSTNRILLVARYLKKDDILHRVFKAIHFRATNYFDVAHAIRLALKKLLSRMFRSDPFTSKCKNNTLLALTTQCIRGTYTLLHNPLKIVIRHHLYRWGSCDFVTFPIRIDHNILASKFVYYGNCSYDRYYTRINLYCTSIITLPGFRVKNLARAEKYHEAPKDWTARRIFQQHVTKVPKNYFTTVLADTKKSTHGRRKYIVDKYC